MRLRLLAATAVTVVAMTGCGAPTDGSGGTTGCGPVHVAAASTDVTPLADAPEPHLPVTVDSADGRRVTVTDASRILPVNLYGSIAEIVFSLGLGDRVVGRDNATTFPSAAHLPLVTPGGHDLTAEGVLALDPTVVIADGSIGPPEVLEMLRRSGIPVVLIDDEQTLPGVSRHIRQVAAALGVSDAGELLVKRVEESIDRAQQAAPTNPPRAAFLYLRGTAGVYLLAGDGSGADAMIEAIGAEDAGTALGLSGFRPLTSEGLISAAPEVILVMAGGLDSVNGMDGLLALPGVAQTPAGEHRRIVVVEDGQLLSFGPRTGEMVAALAEAVYQECP